MMSEMERVLAALRDHADETRWVQGTYRDVAEWIGEEASGWDIHGLMVELNAEGAFGPERPYMTGGGRGGGEFKVRLVR